MSYFFGVVGFTSAGDDHTTKFWVWNPGDQAEVRNVHRANSEAITAMVQSPNRRFLATGSDDRTVKLFNTQIDESKPTRFFAQERFTFTDTGAPILRLAISANSRILAAGDEEGKVHFWCAAAPEEPRTEVSGDSGALKKTRKTARICCVSHNCDKLQTQEAAKMDVHLPEDLQDYVQSEVQCGHFASEKDAIEEAVRLLRDANSKT